MNKQQEALKLALETLQECRRDPRLKYEHSYYDKTIAAIREAMAEQRPQNCGTGYCSCIECPYEQPAQEPVVYVEQSILDWLASDRRGPTAYAKTTLAKRKDGKAQAPLYTSPPTSKPWVGLTQEDWMEFKCKTHDEVRVGLDVAAKLREKNA